MEPPVSETVCVSPPWLHLHIHSICLSGLRVRFAPTWPCPCTFLLWPVSGLYYRAVLFPIRFFLFPAPVWQLPLSVFAVLSAAQPALLLFFSFLCCIELTWLKASHQIPLLSGNPVPPGKWIP